MSCTCSSRTSVAVRVGYMSLLERLSSRLLVSRVIMSTDQAAQERAHALAAEEGLVLIPADNLSGYKGVTPTQRSNQSSSIGGGFCARVRENGRDVHLGTFPTACEAALCYARHTKVRKWRQPASIPAPIHTLGSRGVLRSCLCPCSSQQQQALQARSTSSTLIARRLRTTKRAAAGRTAP